MNRPQPDAGFTLIELLVVLVIMPMVIGAIAAAIIISEQDSGVASTTLSDSSCAQTTSEYFVRDVQGAQYVTTDSSASNPAVCVNPTLPNPTLVLGLCATSCLGRHQHEHAALGGLLGHQRDEPGVGA